MITEELISFIKSELALGKTRDQIKAELLAGGGWKSDDLDEAFLTLNNPILPVSDTPSVPPTPLQPKKTNKIFAIVLIVLFLFGVSASAYFFKDEILSIPFVSNLINKEKVKVLLDESVNIIKKEPISEEPTENQPVVRLDSGSACDFGNTYNIRDQENLIVKDAEVTFLAVTKTSKEYFDKYFKFECAADLENGKHVIYRYFIGDYSFQIYLIKFTGSNGPFYQDYTDIKFDKFDKLLSSREAINKLKLCLGTTPKNLEVRLVGDRLYLFGNDDIENGAGINLKDGNCQTYGLYDNV